MPGHRFDLFTAMPLANRSGRVLGDSTADLRLVGALDFRCELGLSKNDVRAPVLERAHRSMSNSLVTSR